VLVVVARTKGNVCFIEAKKIRWKPRLRPNLCKREPKGAAISMVVRGGETSGIDEPQIPICKSCRAMFQSEESGIGEKR
jgi:hypothetical protein